MRERVQYIVLMRGTHEDKIGEGKLKTQQSKIFLTRVMKS